MRIESIIRRPEGTTIELDGATYHFAPQPDGRHIAEVTDPAHVRRLLNIPEGYQPAEISDQTDPAPAPAPVTPVTAPDTHPDVLQIVDPVTPSAPVEPVAAPVEPAEAPEKATDAPKEPTPAVTSIKAAIAAAPQMEPPAASEFDNLTDEELAERFKARFDRLPNPRSSRKKVIEALLKPEA